MTANANPKPFNVVTV